VYVFTQVVQPVSVAAYTIGDDGKMGTFTSSTLFTIGASDALPTSQSTGGGLVASRSQTTINRKQTKDLLLNKVSFYF